MKHIINIRAIAPYLVLASFSAWAYLSLRSLWDAFILMQIQTVSRAVGGQELGFLLLIIVIGPFALVAIVATVYVWQETEVQNPNPKRPKKSAELKAQRSSSHSSGLVIIILSASFLVLSAIPAVRSGLGLNSSRDYGPDFFSQALRIYPSTLEPVAISLAVIVLVTLVYRLSETSQRDVKPKETRSSKDDIRSKIVVKPKDK